MLTIVIWFLISAVLSAFIGLLFSIGMRSDSDDMEQVEYLSRWSDMKRLRKLEMDLFRVFPGRRALADICGLEGERHRLER